MAQPTGACDIVRVVEAEIDGGRGTQLQSLLQSSFPEYPARSYFKLPPHFRYIASIGPEIVAQLGVELRVVRVGEEIFRTFGIVDLCVKTTERSHGLATSLLTHVADYASMCDIDFLLLFADDDRLYRANGWNRVDNPCIWVKIHEHVTLGIGRNDEPGAMMVKGVGDAAWPAGEVDLLGHIF